MELPIRNYTDKALTLFIEPYCREHEIPAGGEAIVRLQDGEPHSLDYHPDNFVSLWDEGMILAEVEVFPTHQSLRSKPNITSE